ncbi:MAG: diguanylate cyclase [Gammaproteobacteria bacterium]|nr:diguanylate cyclase [Gammaproteobacteria bacterium]MBT8135258.1 diguanylate cyclase [Gammaproteobacteria bacterium]NNJ50078.1 diguanylate cyclase [Gammaproteobacteria bacterium]
MVANKKHKLRKLQDKYIAQFPGKLNALNRVWLKALHDGDALALSQLCQQAHNLAGSAGTFGFSAVSVEARNLENTLRALDKDQELSGEVEEVIADALQRIVSLVELGPEQIESGIAVESDENIPVAEFDRLIYVIEDDELLAREIAAQLYYFDYEVEIFSVISQAMEAIKLRMPSAMILDVQLPEGELAGPEFAMALNEYSTTSVPTIFISSRDDWQARLAAVRACGSAYLTKPLDFNELLECVDRLTLKQQPEAFKILIVDDMEVLAEHYAAVLGGAGMQVKTVSSINDLLEVLSDFQPELILMDIYMPQCSGLEAAKIIRQKDELLSVPIVFLSTESDTAHHVSAMELGGDDFLQKPIMDSSLVVAVRTRAERFRSLRNQMNRDGLTGLLNHVSTKTHLEAEISRALRQHEALCFAMLDIDHFKQVNDSYGHPVGDRVIKSVARMLTKRLRKSDFIGRYGGEEFAIILPETDIKTARSLLDDIRQNFSQIVQQNNDIQFSCTLSAGVTQLSPNDNLDSIINTADDALYKAKNSGRNKVCEK